MKTTIFVVGEKGGFLKKINDTSKQKIQRLILLPVCTLKASTDAKMRILLHVSKSIKMTHWFWLERIRNILVIVANSQSCGLPKVRKNVCFGRIKRFLKNFTPWKKQLKIRRRDKRGFTWIEPCKVSKWNWKDKWLRSGGRKIWIEEANNGMGSGSAK